MAQPEQDLGFLDSSPVCSFSSTCILQADFWIYGAHRDDTDFQNSISDINCP